MHRAKKRLGQNFLNSRAIARDIAKAGNLKEGEVAVEIGPGKGILTQELLEFGAKVIAIEKDVDLVSVLQEKFEKEIKEGRLTIVSSDIRQFSPADYQLKTNNYKLISNIPYYLTGEIIRRFLEEMSQPETIIFLVQDEVAKRIVARPKSDKRAQESILSISVKVYGKPSYIKKVPARYFSPSPKVDSAILKIENISKENFRDLNEKWFFKVVSIGFAHKRKFLLGNLSKIYSKENLEVVFKDLNLPKDVRAENVFLKDWMELARKLYSESIQKE